MSIKENTDKLIAGALFDFTGYLTTLKKPITFGSFYDASLALKHLKKWAKMKNLNLDKADVKGWNK